MATRFYGDLYSSASGAKPKDKWRKIFPAGYKSTAKAVSTFLRYPIALSMKPHYTHTVPFTTDDKLIILFGYKEKFVVYKKLNSTVAILENPVFKQSTPPMMFDGAKVGALLHNIEPKLMYAVAKTDFCEQEGIKFCRNDVLLILAECRTIFLGITEDHGVGFFPSETVEVITKPQLCFFEGMMLSVTAVANFKANEGNQLSVQIGQTYDITKGRDSLFDWFASNHRKVPLHAVNGVSCTDILINL
ncbi:hypothetical protein HOLleu_20085 [Holothuria leucospilota]|uniref:Uncharacterized protein n=1 Tax=Holothuria leucospilota TaxID=206669 RepID=A0A9Q1C197_HOLLE|nr:hypothetical protein HOLleu_20085 [Holothuria leucospilota]